MRIESVINFRNFFQGADGDIRESGSNNGNYRYYCQPVYSPRFHRLDLYFSDTCDLENRSEQISYRNCGLRKVKKILRELEREERKEFDYQVEHYGVDAPEFYA